ncbi:hypothetical protein [Halobacillus sp. Marseille-Q1614]|uniref:hypothetical protein n=1 Tax=Halobacillus sp. Marseille-Q1614 TaxID=2709134 RepID=UPI00156F88C4|nr:hypothetical protein [Halobacillus sp. Marseille-Q1614]
MTKAKWKDPGIIMVIALLLISGVVWLWWPTEVYWLGISLAGWLMFFCFFIWLLLTVIYVIWIEKIEKRSEL